MKSVQDAVVGETLYDIINAPNTIQSMPLLMIRIWDVVNGQISISVYFCRIYIAADIQLRWKANMKHGKL